jgi:hypothetical protein
MKKRWIIVAGLAVALAGRAGLSVAFEQKNDAAISIRNGINRFVLDGNEFLAFRAWRENFNAHGFDVVTLYVRDGDQWNLVPLFGSVEDKEDTEHDLLTVSGGADCVLHDFRLLNGTATQPARIILADREITKSYADADTVHFTYYELAKNDAGNFGRPALYFKKLKASVAKEKYCDVNDAFNKELHLGVTGHFGG